MQISLVLLACLTLASHAHAIANATDPPDVAAPQPTPTWHSVTIPTLQFDLLTAGDEPRSLRRLEPTVGQRQRIELVLEHLRNRIDESGTRPQERPLPLRSSLLATVTEVDTASVATVSIVIESSVAQAGRLHTIEETEAMRAAAQALRGLQIEMRISASGRVTQLRHETPILEDADHAEVAQRQAERVVRAVTRLLTALPEEPVGTGAQWQTISLLTQDGSEVTETTNFMFERDSDGTLVINRRTHVGARPGTPAPEQIPGAIGVEISHYSGFGMGEVIRGMTFLFPQSTRDEVISTIRYTGRVAGERLDAHDQMFFRISATAKELTEPAESAPRRRIGE